MRRGCRLDSALPKQCPLQLRVRGEAREKLGLVAAALGADHTRERASFGRAPARYPRQRKHHDRTPALPGKAPARAEAAQGTQAGELHSIATALRKYALAFALRSREAIADAQAQLSQRRQNWRARTV